MLKRRYDLTITVPQGIAVLLIVLAVIPSWALPVTLPVPLSFVLGAVLPDLIFRRGYSPERNFIVTSFNENNVTAIAAKSGPSVAGESFIL